MPNAIDLKHTIENSIDKHKIMTTPRNVNQSFDSGLTGIKPLHRFV